MTLASEIRYFERRESEERQAAQNASSPGLREILNVIADRYADQVWSLIERQFELFSDDAGHGLTVEFEQESPAGNSKPRGRWPEKRYSKAAD